MYRQMNGHNAGMAGVAERAPAAPSNRIVLALGREIPIHD